MGWEKSDYKGRVCWEQNGQRVFDTADIEKLQDEPSSCTSDNIKINALWFLYGIFIGLIIGILLGIVLT